MDKHETIAGLISVRAKIVRRVCRLSSAQRDEVFLGSWSPRDLVAHLVGWDYTNIESVKEIRSGKAPGVLKRWNPNWSAFNRYLVQTYKRAAWTEMRAELEKSHAKLVRFLKRVPAADFGKDFGVRSSRGRAITIAEHLQAEIDDEQQHDQQLTDWIKAKAHA